MYGFVFFIWWFYASLKCWKSYLSLIFSPIRNSFLRNLRIKIIYRNNQNHFLSWPEIFWVERFGTHRGNEGKRRNETLWNCMVSYLQHSNIWMSIKYQLFHNLSKVYFMKSNWNYNNNFVINIFKRNYRQYISVSMELFKKY